MTHETIAAEPITRKVNRSRDLAAERAADTLEGRRASRKARYLAGTLTAEDAERERDADPAYRAPRDPADVAAETDAWYARRPDAVAEDAAY